MVLEVRDGDVVRRHDIQAALYGIEMHHNQSSHLVCPCYG